MPYTHRAFSRLDFAGNDGAAAELADEDEPVPDVPPAGEREVRPRVVSASGDEDQITGKYLSDDDIEECNTG